MKKYIQFFGHLMLLVAAVMTGAAGNVMLAAATLPAGTVEPTPLAGGGATATAGEPYREVTDSEGKVIPDPRGISTTLSSDLASPDLHEPDVDKLITKIRPKATPLANIMRYAKTVNINGMEYEHFSLATRPIKTTLTAEVTSGKTGVFAVEVADAMMFDVDDTVWVKDIKGYKEDGAVSEQDLVLHVVEASGTDLKVVAVNGQNTAYGTHDKLPVAIPSGTVLIRMGKSCTELDSQTAAFANVPTPEKVYCQIFMMQVEQSTIEKMRNTRVDWSFSDLEEDSIFDMRRGQEGSLWFGYGAQRIHAVKKNQRMWFCQGIWYQAGKDIEIGKADGDAIVITDDQLVDFNRALFTGDGAGSDKKVLFAGSDLMAALEKIKSDKVRVTKDTVEVWDLRFTSMVSNFGEVLAIYHPGFDEYEMADKGFVLDPEMLTRVQALSFKRNVLDLDALGVRNSTAVVLREALALVLRNKNAHARVSLAKA